MAYPFDCISDLVFVETPLEKSDVILIPGGSHPQLARRAAELYHQGYAPFLLPSGGVNSKLGAGKTEWKFLCSLLEEMGVPEIAILHEDRAQNTFENALFSRQVIEEKGLDLKRALMVCKAYHSRRALLTYQAVFPLDVTFYVAPVIDLRGISRDNWFTNPAHAHLVMGEVAKIGEYFGDKISSWWEQRRGGLVEEALKWAADRLGETMYMGLCYAFCEDAYELGAEIILDGQGRTAREAADAYLARMAEQGLRAEGSPPRGSYVFFDCVATLQGETRNWGHIGLALGDGRLIHAWDVVRIDDLHGVELLATAAGDHPEFAGWAPPEIFLQGMHEKA
jgi:uncharacterized SAM-binding protein YcdF (DUF218 family)